jgi:hypothetical protein
LDFGTDIPWLFGTIAEWETGPHARGDRPGRGKPTAALGLPYCAEHRDFAYKRSFAHKLRIRDGYYAGAGALPHHDLAA